MHSVQITFRDVPTSPAIETHIRKKADKLNTHYPRIIGCHIVIEQPQKHKHNGKLYNVRIDVKVPGKELVTTYKADEDIYIAIREAFSAIMRQLEEYGRIRHGQVKTHDGLQKGVVSRIFNEGYGFIEGIDGNEYYFGMTNVCYPTFDQLLVGDRVEFIDQILDDGMQAHRVRRIRNHSD